MFNCFCTDYDGPDVSETTWRKARVTHRCCECRAVIPAGARYQHVRGLWDGTWETIKTCQPCATIRDDFTRCGYVYGELWETLREAYRDRDDEDVAWLELPERT